MIITPQTEIRLIKSPLAISNKNQLTFASKQAQENYFLSLPFIEDFNASYQRKDNVIRFNKHIDTILNYDYCMYKNSNYSNKWFYAFITDMKYLNDNCTEISIITDVFQTWQFDINYNQSFIEREIVSVADDLPNKNLIPEGLEFGELKIDSTVSFDELLPVAVIAYTRNPKDDGYITDTPPAQGVIVNGIPNGMFFWIVSFKYLQGALQTINSAGHGDAILTVFTVPAFSLVGFNTWTLEDIISGVTYWLVSDFKANPISKTFASTPNTIDGYTPRNQKLRSYPYMYLGFNPPNGTSKIYRYEDFSNGTPQFKMYSEINQNPLLCFIPQNYRGISSNNTQDIATMQGYPTIGWITDVFNTWLAQNSEIISLQAKQEEFNYTMDAIKGGVGMISDMGSTLAGNYGSATGIVSKSIELAALDKNHEFYIRNQMAQIEKQSLLPNNGQVSGSNATLLGYDLMDNNIFISYSIKREYAERLDKYFDMFGYTVNLLKNIDINKRPNWDYIKTIGANLTGDIPQYDLQTIKDMFDNGITFWHNPATFLDYSQNNR